MNNISISSFNTFAHCGRKWWFSYHEKMRKPTTSPHLIFGSAVHKSIEDFSISIAEEKDFTVKDMKDSFVECWKEGIEENDIVWNNRTQVNKLHELGCKLAEIYYYQHSNYTPLSFIAQDRDQDESQRYTKPSVEIYFNAPVYKEDGSVDTENQFSGIIDLVARDLNNGKISIIDHKTSADSYTDFQISTNLQLVLYAHAFRYLLKEQRFPELIGVEKEDEVRFNVLVKRTQAGKEPWIEEQSRVIEQHEIDNLMIEVRSFIKARDAAIFLPNRGSHCDNKYIGCDFSEECKAFYEEKGMFD